jgi:hypothetical protein
VRTSKVELRPTDFGRENLREMLEIAVLIFVVMKILNPAFTQKRGDVLKNLGSDLGTASPMQARPPLPRRNKPTKFSTARLQLAAVQN